MLCSIAYIRRFYVILSSVINAANMNFRTIVDIPLLPCKLRPQAKFMCIGSCFAQEMGDRMIGSLPSANVLVNPNGVLYNPASISMLLESLTRDSFCFDSAIFHGRDGLWHSWLHTSKFVEENRERLSSRLEQIYKDSKSFLKHSNFLIITWGTSHVYMLRDSSHFIVSNCHKENPEKFRECRLTVEEILHDYIALIKKLHQINPELQIVISVSPYRYSKLGYNGSNTSKAILLLAAEQLCSMFDNVIYFPAYEILKDELRDYRFYASDMLHPSELAVDYIWERFKTFCFSDDLISFANDMQKLHKALRHKVENNASLDYEKFVSKIEILKKNIEQKWKISI